jgi:hypothetical protein
VIQLLAMKCYDCGTETEDVVMERRQVSGGGQGDFFPQVFANDFRDVPVHADRRACIAAKDSLRLADMRLADPFFDVPA